jgi:hypothetical protein
MAWTRQIETSVAMDNNRRKHERIPGPFDGRRIDVLVTPVSIYDLSEGGCFINAMHEQKPGVVFRLEIDLPHVGGMTFTAETVGTRGEFGYAVRFIEMTFEATLRLQQAIDKLKGPAF